MATKTPKQQAYNLFILLISVFSILLIGIMTLVPINPEYLIIIQTLDYFICAIFFIDFLVTLIRSENKKKYLITWGWFDVLSSIPAVYFLRYFRFARIIRVGRVLRGIRAGKIMTSFVMGNRAQSGVIGAMVMTVLLVFIGSILVLQAEQGSGGNINTAGDAIWWAITTMTTVGYGDKYPLSYEGRAIAGILMFAGIGLFGVVSGFVASWFISPSSAKGEKERDAIKQDVEILQAKMDSLNSKIEIALQNSDKMICPHCGKDIPSYNR